MASHLAPGASLASARRPADASRRLARRVVPSRVVAPSTSRPRATPRAAATPDDIAAAATAAADRAADAFTRLAASPEATDALAASASALASVRDAFASVDVDVDAMTMWRLESALAAAAERDPALAGAVAAAVTAASSLLLARLFGVGASDAAPGSGSDDPSAAPVAVPEGLPSTYDLPAIRAYWRARPLASLKRTAALIARLSGWAAGLLSDVAAGPETVDANSRRRAAALKDIVAEQGPAFVKVGQAIAIRPDLLPPAYLEELQTLLDQVSPFESSEARALVRQQLGGRRLEDVFEDASAFDRPVAAASVGQVYRAKLKPGGFGQAEGELETWGGEVAVKVQRPGILETVTLDLLVIRSLLEAAAALPADGPEALEQIRQGAEGFIPVLDVAAERFLEELDYGLEADNASRFERDMTSVEVVRGAVKVPHVFRGLSGRCVLTQEWVVGRKLTEITDDPASGPLRAKLVQTLLNSYMVQFLETGFLHADPHPGNFMLMEDGRLCILDYGMMTTISEDQRVAFIEYIAHLSARDYDKTLGDLVNLGFVPPELADDPANRAVVVPVLAETLETLYGSGGSAAKKLDKLNEQGNSRVAELTDKLEALAKDYPLRLPPYFVLILRAFGTLEGLGLSTDENYAIVDECFPYVARRMLADDSPRMRAALRSFVYGGSDRLKVSRVRSIAAGFSEFTNSMGDTEAAAAEAAATLAARANASRGTGAALGDADASASASASASEAASKAPRVSSAAGIDPATRDALALVFNAEGNYLQEIIVEEAVRAADALTRGAASASWRALGAGAPAALALGLIAPPLALVPGLNLPLALSLLAAQNGGAVSLTLEDKKNLALLRSVAEAASPEFATRLRRNGDGAGRGVADATNATSATAARLTAEEIRRVAEIVAEVGPAVAPGVRRMGGEFATKLGARLAERSREDLRRFPVPSGAAADGAGDLLSALAGAAARTNAANRNR